MVGCVMKLMAITPLDILVHIRMTWMKDMRDRPNIRDVRGEPIYGAVGGVELLQPPQNNVCLLFSTEHKMLYFRLSGHVFV